MNQKSGTLYIVGAGSGKVEHLTGETLKAIAACRFLAAGKRLLEMGQKFAPADVTTHAIGADLEAARSFIAAGLQEGNVCVLASGDPGCYGILSFLKKHFPEEIRVAPGVSSVQLLAARLRHPWQDWDLVSVHGRDGHLAQAPSGRSTVYFCDDVNTPQAVALLLLEAMPGETPAAVGANLGSESEQVREAGLKEIAAGVFPGNALLLVMPEAVESSHRSLAVPGVTNKAAPGMTEGFPPGIPDELWLRTEKVPLSKSEVRAVVVSKARPAGRRVIWDVGAGTGSYGIECALLESEAHVIAIDKKAAACHAVAANAERFGVRVEVVCAEAPEGLEDLAEPDLVIIGGSEGRLEPIFKAAAQALRPGGRLLVTALLEKTRQTANGLFAQSGLAGLSATRVAISRGEGQEWVENNPVIIFTGDKNRDNQYGQ